MKRKYVITEFMRTHPDGIYLSPIPPRYHRGAPFFYVSVHIKIEIPGKKSPFWN